MRIDRDATPFVALTAVPALVWARRHPRRALGLGLLSGFVTLFFRDPVRTCDHTPVPDGQVVAPADGKVMRVGPAEGEGPWTVPPTEVADVPPGRWQQVTIFLSLTDVHVNRLPYGGVVTRTAHRPGRFLPAFHARARDNERTEIWVCGPAGRTVVTHQVVGVLARRIVLRARVGQTLPTGARIGLMRFGSRIDVFVPPSCTVLVAAGQRVRGGHSVIAGW